MDEQTKQELGWASYGAPPPPPPRGGLSRPCMPLTPAMPVLPALLSNTKAKLCVVCRDGVLVCARGAVGGGGELGEQQLLAQLAAVLAGPVGEAQRQGTQLVRALGSRMPGSPGAACVSHNPTQSLPQFTDKTWLLGAGSLVVQPLGGTSSLVLFSPAQNAFGRKSVAWVAALGAKMEAVLR